MEGMTFSCAQQCYEKFYSSLCWTEISLFRINDDLMNLQKIVEDSERVEWSNYLPDGYKLKQTVETQFGTQYIVVERFLKSCEKIWALIINHGHISALAQYNRLLKITEGGIIFCIGGYYLRLRGVLLYQSTLSSFKKTDNSYGIRECPTLRFWIRHDLRSRTNTMSYKRNSCPADRVNEIVGGSSIEYRKGQDRSTWPMACWMLLASAIHFWHGPPSWIPMRAESMANVLSTQPDSENDVSTKQNNCSLDSFDQVLTSNVHGLDPESTSGKSVRFP